MTKKTALLCCSFLSALPGLVWASGLQPPMAGADAPPAQSAPAIQEVIVTAQKRAQSISTVPLSISAFSQQALQNAGVNDAKDLTLVVPGLTYAKTGANTPIYTLRGVGFDSTNISATSPVGIYVDEIAYAYPYMSGGPLFDLERTEVLKGPQGTLYGRNTTGGLINFITARPGKTWTGDLEASVGNYGTTGFNGDFSGPLSDTLGLRIAGASEGEADGWQRSITRGDHLGKKSLEGFRASLDWAPVSRVKSELTFNYWRDDSDTQAAQAVQIHSDEPALVPAGVAASIKQNPSAEDADWTPASAATGAPPLRNKARFYGISERLTYDLNDFAKLTSLTGFNHLQRNDTIDEDGTPFQIAGSDEIGKIQSLSQELRVSGDFRNMNYVGGVYYAHDTLLDTEFIEAPQAGVVNLLRDLAPLFNPNIFNPGVSYSPAQLAATGGEFYDASKQTSTTKSVFGNVEYRLTDQIKLSGGLRYSSDELRAAGCTYDLNNSYAPLFNTVIAGITGSHATTTENGCTVYSADFSHFVGPEFLQKLSEDSLSYRFSGSYSFSRDALVYASVSQGYKSGAFPVLPANVSTQLEPAKQEKVIAYEIGNKDKFFDRRVQFNAAGFYYDYDDKQEFGYVLDPAFTTLERVINVPKSRVYGVESDVTWLVDPYLTLQVAGTLLKSEVQQFSGYDDLAVATNFKGKEFAFTPDAQASFSADYRRPINEAFVFEGTLSGSYQSRTFGDLANTSPYKIDGYVLLNANVAISTADDKWRLGLYGHNITNANYGVYTGYLRDVIFRYTGMPVTFGASLSRHF